MPKVLQSTVAQARHLQPERHALDVEVEEGADAGSDPSRELLLEAHLGRGRVGPERAGDDPVVGGQGRQVGQPLLARERPALAPSRRPSSASARLAVPVPSMAVRRAVIDRDGVDARGSLRGEESRDAGPLVGLDVEEERGRRVGRQVGRELSREVALDEGDVEDDERPEAEGEDRADGPGSRASRAPRGRGGGRRGAARAGRA